MDQFFSKDRAIRAANKARAAVSQKTMNGQLDRRDALIVQQIYVEKPLTLCQQAEYYKS